MEPLPFRVNVSMTGETTTIALVGDFDAVAVDCFELCLLAALTTSEGTIVVDMSDLSFIDSAGVCTLLRARHVVKAERRTLLFGHVSAPVARLLELVGVRDLFDRVDTTVS